jgi:NAD(P) transhydrogenase
MRRLIVSQSRLGLQRFSQQRALNTGILRESPNGEKRVSMVPAVAQKFIKEGYKVIVEEGAGARCGLTDAAYKEAGCTVLPRAQVISQSELLFSINPPPAEELAAFKGKNLVSWVGRRLPEGVTYVDAATKAGVTLWDTTSVPRITIAQKMDVLSSQAKCAGHRAVLEGAYAFERFYQGEITAAGKYPPAHTMVLGIGVAGLAAMGTSNALGAVVRAWDVRDVSDQVTSMGGKWIKVDFKEDGAGSGGYAKESSEAFQKAQKEVFHKNCKECDIVISTAAIPGRKSPVLIEDYMVKDMKPGSVIVDLAAAGGGNCTLTKAGETIVTDNGVTIIGYTDLAGRMGTQASAMYATNMLNMVTHITGKGGADAFLPAVDSALAKDDGDIIVKSVICCKNGAEVVAPPPPEPTPVKKKEAKAVKKVEKADPGQLALQQSGVITAGSAALLASSVGADMGFMTMLNTFGLAGAAGYQVVWGVTHALHTPLMAVTNAISGLTAVGGMLLMGQGGGGFAQFLAQASVGISTVNIAGGFLVTKRMLDLFRKPGEVDHTPKFVLPLATMAVAPWAAPTAIPTVGTVSGLMCIGSIGGLASQQTAQFGCALGVVGVTGAMAATIHGLPAAELKSAVALIGGGTALGLGVGKSVSPMALPQTVAAFHALVGLAAVNTCLASHLIHPHAGVGHKVGAMLGNFIGGVTFTGSLVAFGKLNGNMSSAALNLPGKNQINAGGFAAQLAMLGLFCTDVSTGLGNTLMYTTTALSAAMGYHLVASVGGGDMPCCVTVLNSYSGWALVAEGFLLGSQTLTVVGSLIGFSGAILTKIMCDAMNRDIVNVIFGGMQAAAPKKDGQPQEVKEHRETNPQAVADLMLDSKEVMIVPGYGMAVSQAQRAVADIANTLVDKGIGCRFSIHPVAGRMPGQMNVLLAEAGVPYDWVYEMEEVQDDMPHVDVCLVVGANDTTNEAAELDPDCSIAGMPVIKVWEAKNCIFLKRSMAAGYADLENPVFFKEATQMLLGDGRKSCEEIAAAMKTR